MPLTVTAHNRMLDFLGTQIKTASLHSADPGTTGASELTGGSPAYARKAVTWNAAATSNLDQANAPVFDIPGGATVAHVGYWSGDTTPVFLGSDPVTAESYAAQGTYTLSDSDISLAG